MDFIALLMVGESLSGSEPAGLGQVGGISLLERQARMALKAGAARVIVVAPALPADIGGRRMRAPAFFPATGRKTPTSWRA